MTTESTLTRMTMGIIRSVNTAEVCSMFWRLTVAYSSPVSMSNAWSENTVL